MAAVSRASSCASDPQCVCVFIHAYVCVSLWTVCLRDSEGKCVWDWVPISPMMLCHLPCVYVCESIHSWALLPTVSRVIETCHSQFLPILLILQRMFLQSDTQHHNNSSTNMWVQEEVHGNLGRFKKKDVWSELIFEKVLKVCAHVVASFLPSSL